MRHIKPYQIFEASASAPALTAVQIDWLDKCVDGSWKLNPQTGLVDVDGNFNCSGQGLTDFKGVKFGVVDGYFGCHNNALISLEGAPQTIRGGNYFVCHGNPVSGKTLKKIYDKMKEGTSYLAAVESLWSKIPQDDQVLLYADDFKWVTPEQGRGLVALRAYQAVRGML